MPSRPFGLWWRSHTTFILTTVCIGVFTDMFLYSLIIPVLPFMLHDRLGVPKSNVQQHVSGLLSVYAVSTLIGSPVVGIIADRQQTRRGPYLTGLIALGAATILLFSSRYLSLLYIARVLQGISAAVVWSVGIALAVDTVGVKNLGKTLGTMSSATLAGVLFAPMIGGILYDKTGVLGPTVLSTTLIAIDLVLRLLVVEKKTAAEYERILAEGSGAVVAGEVSGTPNSLEGRDPSLEGDHMHESHESEPLLQHVAFKITPSQHRSWIVRLMPIVICLGNSRLAMALALTTMQGMILGAFEATIPIRTAVLFDFDSFHSGLMMMPVVVSSVIFGPILGYVVDKTGPKVVAASTLLLQACTLVLLRLPRPGGADQIALFAVITGLCSISISGCSSATAVESGLVVDSYHKANPEYFGRLGPYAQLYALSAMAYTLGLGIGPEITGQLQPWLGFGNTFIILAVTSALTAVMAVRYVGGKHANGSAAKGQTVP
ncbi:hypothetical protein B0A52_03838 [Exophiala mesophila]|uniref:Major facilitator superfamily (MFS) profile domain-containing protein n=1 Tax=Exophiala mesophila TaxID=212818 RepID=A0A438N7C7_EXOME|nr:hypothetical protein B0A52_03838 [Exophiala mesophila]